MAVCGSIIFFKKLSAVVFYCRNSLQTCSSPAMNCSHQQGEMPFWNLRAGQAVHTNFCYGNPTPSALYEVIACIFPQFLPALCGYILGRVSLEGKCHQNVRSSWENCKKHAVSHIWRKGIILAMGCALFFSFKTSSDLAKWRDWEFKFTHGWLQTRGWQVDTADF